MGLPFPFDQPLTTSFYLTMYLLTFALHQAFMHYVLAGSLYVAWSAFAPGRGTVPRIQEPLAAILRDWMPFLLSAAITAGVAPLLFIQILYQHQFYTANLLLWWRWMLVVPVLILAFYLLYLLKSTYLWQRPYVVQVVTAAGTAACFVFVGFCWTANHLLSDPVSDWPTVYATGRLPFSVFHVVPRMLVWIGGAFTTMSVIVGWQFAFYRASATDNPPADLMRRAAADGVVEQTPATTALQNSPSSPIEVRALAGLALGGLTLATMAAFVSLATLTAEKRAFLFTGPFLPDYVIVMVGVVLQLIGWLRQWQSACWTTLNRVLTSLGVGACLWGMTVIREGVRFQSVDTRVLKARMAQMESIGGFWLFLMTALVVTFLIAWCIRLVQRAAPR